MNIKEQLINDYKEAMKAKDDVKKNTINLARAAIKQIEVDERREVTEEDVIKILTKQVKMRKDALEDFIKAERNDLAEAYKDEIEILSKYLPELMSEAEIIAVVTETAKSMEITDPSQKGKLMGACMGKLKGKADGSLVKQVVDTYFS